MHADAIVHAVFLIFAGAAVMATLALYARQALPVAYIALGLLMGPLLGIWGVGIAIDPAIIRGMAEFGIIFLLFLLGLNLEPQEFVRVMREVTLLTLVSCSAFAAIGFAIALAFGFPWIDAVIIGAAMMFSSTIVGLKLLPTSALHHQHMGEIIVAILLLQDVIAILVLLLIQGYGSGDGTWVAWVTPIAAAPVIFGAAFLCSRYVITNLLYRFDRIQEYVFLLAIGWCLALAELAEIMGLSYEIGAFIAGVSLATSPVARFVAESLKAAAALLIKPYVFDRFLERAHEAADLSRQIGVRLGQISEFSLLVAIAGIQSGVLSEQASYTIQTATILTFIGSTYWIVLRYPTPVAVSEALRRD
ncbi:MAG: sodium:proton antiporter [Proteobacteria bacterium SW_6_67_9]|nr:MAG: sodium:proton antiporter [Proteobacteria bacterium SW_6_67_9]